MKLIKFLENTIIPSNQESFFSTEMLLIVSDLTYFIAFELLSFPNMYIVLYH